MIPLDEECSTALRLLALAFEKVKELQINENFALDFVFGQIPGRAGGELESYRKCYFRREACGAIQQPLLTPEELPHW